MRRRWVWLSLAIVVLLLGIAAVRFSDVVRLVAIAKLRLATGRAVSIDALRFDPFSGRLAVRGFRVKDRDGTPLGDIEQLDATVHLRSLLRGHVWIQDLAIVNSTVRVVRLSNGDFNFSDLIPRGETKGASYDVTVGHFSLRGGTVTLEDRVLTPWRTWHSREITIDAHDVSTTHRGGRAEASTVLEGAPVAVRIEDLQLVPIHLRGKITASGMDLGLARLYVPATAPVVPERGRLDSTVEVVHDAREGTRVDMRASATDLVAVRPPRTDPAVAAPALAVEVRDLRVAPDGAITLAHVSVTGHGTLMDSDVSPPAQFDLARVRLVADDVTWPVQRAARVALDASLRTGGDLSVKGTARTQPNVADLEVRLTGLALDPWARYVPGPTRLAGVGDAAFSVHADLDPGRLSARARGQAGIQRVLLSNSGRTLLGAERAEVLGVDFEWPSRLAVERVRIRRPSASVARDADGQIDLLKLFGAPAPDAPRDGGRRAPSAWNGEVRVGEVAVEGGTLAWADAAVTPATRFTVSQIDATARDVKWPLPPSLVVQLRAAAPGGGRAEVAGRVGIDPINADVRVVAKGVDLAPYAPYVPIRGRVTGRTDLDLALVVPTDLGRTPLVARGRVALSRGTLFDGKRAIVAVDRAELTGVDVEWPGHVTVDAARLNRPWALVERDASGGFPVIQLVTLRGEPGRDDATPAETAPPAGEQASALTVVTIGRVVVEGGGARVVDHTVKPEYVEEITRVSLRASGFGTASEQPGRLDLTARLGARGTLAVRGTVRPDPLLVDLRGDVRDVAIPSLNSYVQQYTGWRASNGRISTKATYRVDGDRLDARNEIALSRLEVVRATATDTAQQRVGLPLGMIVSLMKDSRGDIALALPIGGRLGDPQFDVREIIWAAVRRISIKAITLPVSWIGRVHVGRDAKIQDVTIDPVPFEPGRAVLTAAGEGQLGRLAAFMHRLPDTKMVLTPVVSLGDIDELRREEVRKGIARRAAAEGRPPAEIAARLFAEHHPRERVPASLEEIVAAISRDEEPPDAAAVRLAKERMEIARAALKKAGIDIARLEIHTEAEAVETRGGGHVELALTEQVRQKRGLLAELLAKLRETVRAAMGKRGNESPAASPRIMVAPK